MLKAKEHDIQKGVVKALELAGLTVLWTSTMKQYCPSGVAKGVPDILVFTPGIPYIIGIEMKRGPKAKRSPEQIRMADQGFYSFATNIEEALDWVEKCLTELAPGKTTLGHINRLHAVRRGLQ